MTDFTKKIFGEEAKNLYHLLGFDKDENIVGMEGVIAGKSAYVSKDYIREGHLVLTLTIYDEEKRRW
jgi:hypothetical protein